MNLNKYNEGIKTSKIPVRDNDGMCVDWSADKVATLSTETLNYVIRLESGGQAVVGSEKPSGGCFRLTPAFNEETTKLSEVSGQRRKIIKDRAIAIAKQIECRLSWRRGLVWVYPDGMSDAYTVDYGQKIPEFLRKIREVQYNILVSQKVQESWR